jgi:hypothetical protein
MIIHDIEQRSPEWYKLRMGVPTASCFDQLITPTGRPSKSATVYARFLAAELYIGRPLDMWGGNAWTERGREMEGQALSLYEFANDVDARKVGFITNDDATAGCSPDALIGDDGMIEVKCLKAENHIGAIMHHKATGTCPPDYVPQTQGQLLLCQRKWCDLVFYHPELPMLTIRLVAQEEYAAILHAQIPAVITERDAVLATLRSLDKRS